MKPIELSWVFDAIRGVPCVPSDTYVGVAAIALALALMPYVYALNPALAWKMIGVPVPTDES